MCEEVFDSRNLSVRYVEWRIPQEFLQDGLKVLFCQSTYVLVNGKLNILDLEVFLYIEVVPFDLIFKKCFNGKLSLLLFSKLVTKRFL